MSCTLEGEKRKKKRKRKKLNRENTSPRVKRKKADVILKGRYRLNDKGGRKKKTKYKNGGIIW